ncbi:MAG: carbon-nitrogen hydrolase family protein [Pseudomonadota bacterium]
MPKVAVAQMNSSDDVGGNLETIEALCRSAVEQGCALLALPECCAFMQRNRAQLFVKSQPESTGMICAELSRMAKANKLWLMAGSVSFINADGSRVLNRTLVFGSDGQLAAEYDKIHLFDVELSTDESYFESGYTDPGDKLRVVDTPIGSIGLSICYDLRFPNMYRQLVGLGAEILTVPSAFAVTTGRVHWEPMLRTRAIENACYVLAPAQTGHHPSGRSTFGHSMIVSPWGEITAEIDKHTGIVCGVIDEALLADTRRRLPGWQIDRRY